MQKKEQIGEIARYRRDGTRVAYQNKDISSKRFGESLKGGSLEVYGIKNSKIVGVRPTNLPTIEAKELRLDNLFEMEDGSLAIIDYESKYSEKNKVKYLGYIAQVSKRVYNEYGEFRPLRLIIIYTADIERGATNPILDMGGFALRLEEAFLTELNPVLIRKQITEKIDQDIPLTEEDQMKLVIYPLTYRGRKAQREAVSEAIDIAETIKDDEQLRKVESGLLVFADKIISNRDIERIIGRLSMTKIERWYDERQKEAVEDERRKQQDKSRSEKEEIVIKLLRSGVSENQVSEGTGFTIEEVQDLAAKYNKKKKQTE